jgi:hypothetical protein
MEISAFYSRDVFKESLFSFSCIIIYYKFEGFLL